MFTLTVHCSEEMPEKVNKTLAKIGDSEEYIGVISSRLSEEERMQKTHELLQCILDGDFERGRPYVI